MTTPTLSSHRGDSAVHLERTGGPPELQGAFSDLILIGLGGRALDDHQAKESAEGRFPDFACFNDLVLIEMKHLETNQTDRLNEVLETKIDPAEKPLFYGNRSAHFITGAVSNGAAVNADLASKLARTVETALKGANQQFRNYRSRHPRKNAVNICVILNSTIPEFSPEFTGRAIHSKMLQKNPQGESRFLNIDAVLYVSEKHFHLMPNGRVGFGLVIFEAMGAINHPWKMAFVDRITDEWSRARTNGPIAEGATPHRFETIHDIPKTLKMYEGWQLEYQRNPYLSELPIQRIKVLYRRSIAFNSLTFLKGSWPKPPREKTAEGLRRFQHVIEETNRRGLDLRLLDDGLLTADEAAEAYADFPPDLVYKLREIFARQREES